MIKIVGKIMGLFLKVIINAENRLNETNFRFLKHFYSFTITVVMQAVNFLPLRHEGTRYKFYIYSFFDISLCPSVFVAKEFKNMRNISNNIYGMD
jgi:hypothetical protein